MLDPGAADDGTELLQLLRRRGGLRSVHGGRDGACTGQRVGVALGTKRSIVLRNPGLISCAGTVQFGVNGFSMVIEATYKGAGIVYTRVVLLELD